MSAEETRPEASGDYIQAHIGDHAQQVAVGKNITQRLQTGGSIEVTAADLEQVRQLFVELKKQIEQLAPADKKSAALERVSELEDELSSGKPQVSTAEYVKNWFGKNLPALLGTVTSVLVNPIVGKIVEVAGEMAADEFKRRFGK